MNFATIVDMTATEIAIAATEAAALKIAKAKEEHIAAFREQIAKIEGKIADLINGKEPAAKAPKVVPLPEIGAFITFVYGRKTATSNPLEKSGVVVAIKPSTVQELENGATRRNPAQIKVQVGDGFDAEFCVIYPAQIKEAGEEPSAEPSGEEPSADETDDQS